jgi:hypothetical protein
MPPVIVPIVEGHSEVESLPILLRRMLSERGVFTVEIRRPIRIGRYRIVKPGELERAVKLAARQPNCRAILVLLDADNDCPAQLGPDLLKRAQAARPDVRCWVVLAKAELETWFVGSVESLRGHCGIRQEASSPPAPEEIRGAKEWLGQQMPRERRYLEVDDQPALADCFDLAQARQACDSFDKLVRTFEDILAYVQDAAGPSR